MLGQCRWGEAHTELSLFSPPVPDVPCELSPFSSWWVIFPIGQRRSLQCEALWGPLSLQFSMRCSVNWIWCMAYVREANACRNGHDKVCLPLSLFFSVLCSDWSIIGRNVTRESAPYPLATALGLKIDRRSSFPCVCFIGPFPGPALHIRPSCGKEMWACLSGSCSSSTITEDAEPRGCLACDWEVGVTYLRWKRTWLKKENHHFGRTVSVAVEFLVSFVNLIVPSLPAKSVFFFLVNSTA